MTAAHRFELTEAQRDAWLEQANILKQTLSPHPGCLFLEFGIPRMGTRVDAIALIGSLVLVLEFKVGEDQFLTKDIDQVMDYALDLQNFHEASHHALIAPVLVATSAS